MKLKDLLRELNVISQCRRYGLELWQCPQFLFLIMGVLICFTSVFSFALGTKYIADPSVVAVIVLWISIVLLVISFLIIRSFERLAEANRMKSEFVSIVSHQLRSPISNLSWALEFLGSGKIGKIQEKQLEYFKLLKENVSRMKELISDLLVVSRIETASLVFNNEEFSLVGVINEAIQEFEPFAGASNVALKFEFEKDLPMVFADPNQMLQVIKNLIDNAIRYIKTRGEVKIKVEKKWRNLHFTISDTGVGIPKEDQKYIFQKFFRSQNVLRRQTQGSGLGLFIAKSIIQRSGGKIGFKSEEGRGSTFWFTLPAKS